jgi:uncharacterized protein (TIGR02594 family)
MRDSFNPGVFFAEQQRAKNASDKPNNFSNLLGSKPINIKKENIKSGNRDNVNLSDLLGNGSRPNSASVQRPQSNSSFAQMTNVLIDIKELIQKLVDNTIGNNVNANAFDSVAANLNSILDAHLKRAQFIFDEQLDDLDFVRKENLTLMDFRKRAVDNVLYRLEKYNKDADLRQYLLLKNMKNVANRYNMTVGSINVLTQSSNQIVSKNNKATPDVMAVLFLSSIHELIRHFALEFVSHTKGMKQEAFVKDIYDNMQLTLLQQMNASFLSVANNIAPLRILLKTMSLMTIPIESMVKGFKALERAITRDQLKKDLVNKYSSKKTPEMRTADATSKLPTLMESQRSILLSIQEILQNSFAQGGQMLEQMTGSSYTYKETQDKSTRVYVEELGQFLTEAEHRDYRTKKRQAIGKDVGSTLRGRLSRRSANERLAERISQESSINNQFGTDDALTKLTGRDFRNMGRTSAANNAAISSTSTGSSGSNFDKLEIAVLQTGIDIIATLNTNHSEFMTVFKKQFNIQLASVNRNIRDFGKEQVRLLGVLIDTVKSLKFKKIPGGEIHAFADGGIYSPGSPRLVGEKGPEIEVPKVGGKILSNKQVSELIAIDYDKFGIVMTKAINLSNIGQAALPKAANSTFNQMKSALDKSQMGLQAKDERYISTQERLSELKNRQLTPAVGTESNIPKPAQLSPLVKPKKSWLAKIIDGLVQGAMLAGLGALLVPFVSPLLKGLFELILSDDNLALIKSKISENLPSVFSDLFNNDFFTNLSLGLGAVLLGPSFIRGIAFGIGSNIHKIMKSILWDMPKAIISFIPKVFDGMVIARNWMSFLSETMGNGLKALGSLLTPTWLSNLFTTQIATGSMFSKIIGTIAKFPLRILGGALSVLIDGVFGAIEGFKTDGIGGMFEGLFKGALTSSSIGGNMLKYALIGLPFAPPFGSIIGALLGGAVQFIFDNWESIKAGPSKLWDTISGVFGNLWGFISSPFIGFFTPIFDSINSLTTGVSKFFSADNQILSFLNDMWGTMSSPFVQFFEFIKTKINDFQVGLMENLTSLPLIGDSFKTSNQLFEEKLKQLEAINAELAEKNSQIDYVTTKAKDLRTAAGPNSGWYGQSATPEQKEAELWEKRLAERQADRATQQAEADRLKEELTTINTKTTVTGMRQKGGPIDSGKTYIAGEGGPELLLNTQTGSYEFITSPQLLTAKTDGNIVPITSGSDTQNALRYSLNTSNVDDNLLKSAGSASAATPENPFKFQKNPVTEFTDNLRNKSSEIASQVPQYFGSLVDGAMNLGGKGIKGIGDTGTQIAEWTKEKGLDFDGGRMRDFMNSGLTHTQKAIRESDIVRESQKTVEDETVKRINDKFPMSRLFELEDGRIFVEFTDGKQFTVSSTFMPKVFNVLKSAIADKSLSEKVQAGDDKKTQKELADKVQEKQEDLATNIISGLKDLGQQGMSKVGEILKGVNDKLNSGALWTKDKGFDVDGGKISTAINRDILTHRPEGTTSNYDNVILTLEKLKASGKLKELLDQKSKRPSMYEKFAPAEAKGSVAMTSQGPKATPDSSSSNASDQAAQQEVAKLANQVPSGSPSNQVPTGTMPTPTAPIGTNTSTPTAPKVFKPGPNPKDTYGNTGNPEVDKLIEDRAKQLISKITTTDPILKDYQVRKAWEQAAAEINAKIVKGEIKIDGITPKAAGQEGGGGGGDKGEGNASDQAARAALQGVFNEGMGKLGDIKTVNGASGAGDVAGNINSQLSSAMNQGAANMGNIPTVNGGSGGAPGGAPGGMSGVSGTNTPTGAPGSMPGVPGGINTPGGIPAVNNMSSGGTNANKAMDYFMSKGWTKEQAAGIVGNLQQESGQQLNPNARNKNGMYGLAQWDTNRRAGFEKKYGKPIQGSTAEEQMEYINWELTQGPEKRAGRALKNATNAQEAAHIFEKKYERSGGSALDKRIANANKIYGSHTPGQQSIGGQGNTPITGVPGVPGGMPTGVPGTNMPTGGSGGGLLSNANKYIGMTEGQNADQLNKFTGVNTQTTPWCGAFVGGVLKESGYRVPKGHNLAKSYLNYGQDVGGLANAKPGDIAVFNRGGGGKGHVGIIQKIEGDKIYLLGGNQGKQGIVSVSARDINKPGGELVGIRRPGQDDIIDPQKVAATQAQGGIDPQAVADSSANTTNGTNSDVNKFASSPANTQQTTTPTSMEGMFAQGMSQMGGLNTVNGGMGGAVNAMMGGGLGGAMSGGMGGALSGAMSGLASGGLGGALSGAMGGLMGGMMGGGYRSNSRGGYSMPSGGQMMGGSGGQMMGGSAPNVDPNAIATNGQNVSTGMPGGLPIGNPTQQAAGYQLGNNQPTGMSGQTPTGPVVNNNQSYSDQLGGKRVSSAYGMRVHPKSGKEKMHTGIDISGAEGTPIKMPSTMKPGVVISAGKQGGYGNVVEVKHEDGTTTKYAHMLDTNVKVGQQVDSNSQLGRMGSTGTSTGNHLHFEVKDENGKFVDPNKHLAKVAQDQGLQPQTMQQQMAQQNKPTTGNTNPINADPSKQADPATWQPPGQQVAANTPSPTTGVNTPSVDPTTVQPTGQQVAANSPTTGVDNSIQIDEAALKQDMQNGNLPMFASAGQGMSDVTDITNSNAMVRGFDQSKSTAKGGPPPRDESTDIMNKDGTHSQRILPDLKEQARQEYMAKMGVTTGSGNKPTNAPTGTPSGPPPRDESTDIMNKDGTHSQRILPDLKEQARQEYMAKMGVTTGSGNKPTNAPTGTPSGPPPRDESTDIMNKDGTHSQRILPDLKEQARQEYMAKMGVTTGSGNKPTNTPTGPELSAKQQVADRIARENGATVTYGSQKPTNTPTGPELSAKQQVADRIARENGATVTYGSQKPTNTPTGPELSAKQQVADRIARENGATVTYGSQTPTNTPAPPPKVENSDQKRKEFEGGNTPSAPKPINTPTNTPAPPPKVENSDQKRKEFMSGTQSTPSAPKPTNTPTTPITTPKVENSDQKRQEFMNGTQSKPTAPKLTSTPTTPITTPKVENSDQKRQEFMSGTQSTPSAPKPTSTPTTPTSTFKVENSDQKRKEFMSGGSRIKGANPNIDSMIPDNKPPRSYADSITSNYKPKPDNIIGQTVPDKKPTGITNGPPPVKSDTLEKDLESAVNAGPKQHTTANDAINSVFDDKSKPVGTTSGPPTKGDELEKDLETSVNAGPTDDDKLEKDLASAVEAGKPTTGTSDPVSKPSGGGGGRKHKQSSGGNNQVSSGSDGSSGYSQQPQMPPQPQQPADMISSMLGNLFGMGSSMMGGMSNMGMGGMSNMGMGGMSNMGGMMGGMDISSGGFAGPLNNGGGLFASQNPFSVTPPSMPTMDSSGFDSQIALNPPQTQFDVQSATSSTIQNNAETQAMQTDMMGASVGSAMSAGNNSSSQPQGDPGVGAEGMLSPRHNSPQANAGASGMNKDDMSNVAVDPLGDDIANRLFSLLGPAFFGGAKNQAMEAKQNNYIENTFV